MSNSLLPDDDNANLLAKLNKEIELGLNQLKAGEKISAAESYLRLRKKILNLQGKSVSETFLQKDKSS